MFNYTCVNVKSWPSIFEDEEFFKLSVFLICICDEGPEVAGQSVHNENAVKCEHLKKRNVIIQQVLVKNLFPCATDFFLGYFSIIFLIFWWIMVINESVTFTFQNIPFKSG